jgi:hypothetical protein
MDTDLSADLSAFPEITRAFEGAYDIAIGSRLLRDSSMKRSSKCGFASRIYNLPNRPLFGAKSCDAQCGFKALTSEAAQEVARLIQDQKRFFGTELLLAERKGYRTRETPVAWIEDLNSRVSIPGTAFDDLEGLPGMRFHPPQQVRIGQSAPI